MGPVSGAISGSRVLEKGGKWINFKSCDRFDLSENSICLLGTYIILNIPLSKPLRMVDKSLDEYLKG